MSETKSLEHSTLKVPYEIINKRFRVTQKVIDREVDQVQNASKDVENALNSSHPIISDIDKLIKCVTQRIEVLKKKAIENVDEELKAAYVCKRKLDHLKGIDPLNNNNSSSSNSNTNDNNNTNSINNDNTNGNNDNDNNSSNNTDILQASIDTWKRIRLDRMVIEHLLRMGFYKTAERLAEHSGIQHLTNLDIFQVSREVENDLTNHKTTKCVLWCIDNKSKLRKINSNIEFDLRIQEFVELVRSNLRAEAVMHARKYFPGFEKTQLKEICECMALLVYQPDTAIEPYKSLFCMKRWKELVTKFRNENYRLFQLSTQSVLNVAVQAGLSALKTPQCYSKICKNLNCPVCQEDFNQIAKNLPFSHCVQSRLICRITGLPLNEHNLPMMLPNGQIFGQLALPEITKENGTVVCPITNTKFSNPKIEKVFVM